MPKKYITVSDEMDNILQQEADDRGAPYATIVREAIREWCQKRGIKLEENVTWGGWRERTTKEDSNEGQLLATA